jgi:hypothetical protein
MIAALAFDAANTDQSAAAIRCPLQYLSELLFRSVDLPGGEQLLGYCRSDIDVARSSRQSPSEAINCGRVVAAVTGRISQPYQRARLVRRMLKYLLVLRFCA